MAGNELFKDIQQVDKLMEQEELENAKMRKRIVWLLPYNFLVIWGTMKYCANIKTIAQRVWPNYQKVKISNLIIVSTI